MTSRMGLNLYCIFKVQSLAAAPIKLLAPNFARYWRINFFFFFLIIDMNPLSNNVELPNNTHNIEMEMADKLNKIHD